jgi:YggT family protein
MTYDQRPTDPAAAPPPEETTPAPPPAAPPPAYAPPPATTNVNTTGTGYVETGPGPIYWVRRVLSFLFGILVVLLLLRIVLLLLIADPSNDIVNFIYSVTEPFVAPFRGMFQFDVVVSGQRAFDVAAVVALIGWTLIYALILGILGLVDRD